MSHETTWAVGVYGGLVLLLVAGMVALSHFLGERHRGRACDQPYESGIDPTGSARLRYGARYYLVGIFFMLFDVEVAIVFAWAAAFRKVGWAGYVEAALFIVTLAVGLVYAWRLGGLDWYSHGRRGRGDEEP
jgi:NADH-quinone oxidoreductase subunit A